MPLISVVMPARNAEATLDQSLQSLVAQSLRDFDLVLIDDGSTDQTAEIADRYRHALNLRLIRHERSQGVAQSINDGLHAADAEYIARLDADDLAHPQRLERQLAYLREMREVSVCGTQMLIFDGDKGPQHAHGILAHPTKSAAIRTALLQRCAIAHPSVMCRRSLFEYVGYYDSRFDFAEDYELWCRASLLGIQFGNIDAPLTSYRKHEGQVSQQKAQLQFERDMSIKMNYMRAWLEGEDPGFLPQFLALQTRFPSREMAFEVMQKCSKAMIDLAARVPDSDEYARIVAGALQRHLA